MAERVGFYTAQIDMSLQLGQIASICMMARNLAVVYYVLLVPLSLSGALRK